MMSFTEAEHGQAADRLLAVSTLDGRYADKMDELSPIVSEYGLIRYRAGVEIAWLGTLGLGTLPDVAPMSDNAHDRLIELARDFNINDALEVKQTEKEINHDVKAVEMWLRSKIGGDAAFEGYTQFPHFGATSEDITNLAYALMMREARREVLVPTLQKVQADTDDKAGEFAELAMLGRTHFQSASPTTIGKEMAVFRERFDEHIKALEDVKIKGKFNGATGNHNALKFAYPEVDWIKATREFVRGLGFEPSETTTQIEPHDWNARLYNEITLGNTILSDLAVDMWMYIGLGCYKLRVKAGEVGSSTMPHKVNPIDFENAEGNTGIANALFQHLAIKLPKSRLQRDLSDSTAMRAAGQALGHTLLAQKSALRGLGKCLPHAEGLASELQDNWAVLAEPLQSVMKRYGVEGAYEEIKAVTRGLPLGETEYHQLVERVSIPEEAKTRLHELTPATYIGYAPEIARGQLN